MFVVEIVDGNLCPPQKPKETFSEIAKNGATTALLLRLCESIFHIGMIVILDSGFCLLRAIIELKKRGVFALALIKIRQYWPNCVDGDKIDKHFENKEI